MRDNYVAKNANKFNRGGAHRDRSKYTRSTGISKHGALDELDDDLALEYELERKADFDVSASDMLAVEYIEMSAKDWMYEVWQFEEVLHPEDFS